MRMRRFSAIALLLLLSGCGSDSTDQGPLPGPGLVGSYGLEAYVDGRLASRSRWTGDRLTLLQDVVGEGVVASYPFVRQPS